MKPFATAIAVVALLVMSSVAEADDPETFWWAGSSTAWGASANWTQSPGSDDTPGSGSRTDDIVYIDDNPNGPQPTYGAAAASRTVDTIDIDANAHSATVSLTVTGGTLTTNGLVTVKGEQSGSDTATLTVSAGTFAPHSLVFEGDTSNRNAIGDCNESVTVSSSTTMTGKVSINITEDKTLTTTAATVGNGNVLSDVEINCIDGSGTFTANSLTLVPGDGAGEYSAVKLCAGTLDVNGEVDLSGSSSVDAEAKLEVSSGASFEPNSLDLNGGTSTSRDAWLDFDEDVTVTAGGSTELSGYIDVDLDPNIVFLSQATTVVDSNTHLNVSGSGSASMTATTLTIDADTPNAARKLTLDAGPLSTSSLVTVRGDQGTATNAEIEVATNSAFSPNSMAFDGGSSISYRTAIGDFNEDVTVSSSTTAQECVSIQVLGGKTLTTNSMTVGVYNTTFGNLAITRPDGSGTGTVCCPSGVTITGGQSSNTTVTVGSDARLMTQ